MTVYSRRAVIAASSAALLLPRAGLAQTGSGSFSWNGLVAQARQLAAKPFADTPINTAADKIDYDAFHKAQFKADRTIWGDLPGDTGVRLFPLNENTRQPIAINLIENGKAKPLTYDTSYFDMPADSPIAALGPNAGFGGFRFMNAARDADWLVFMGASYFRAAGAQKQFGLSARAIAIDTGVGPEQFPRFTTFWLERTSDNSVDVYALLDGAAITGAYRFRNSFDKQGVHQEITAALFPRTTIAELGLMPMTSMFWYDQAHQRLSTDWRPEIHDSDGLLIRRRDGSATLRPITNPKEPKTNAFLEDSPTGFGLLQRDRNFEHYQDDGVFYDRRPSLWAAPTAPLGAGEVRIYEFPTDSEYTDNVCMYWTPTKPPRPGKRIDVAYRLDWQKDEPSAAKPLGKIVDIWRGLVPAGEKPPQKTLRLVVDFDGLAGKKLTPSATVSNGTLVKQAAFPVLGRDGTWRAVVDLIAANDRPVDVQLVLMDGQAMVTEQLAYPLLP